MLESSPVVPGNEAKRTLTDETRRPRKPRSELDPAIEEFETGTAIRPQCQEILCWRRFRDGRTSEGWIGAQLSVASWVACQPARAKDARRSGTGESFREDHSATEARWWGARHRCRGCLPPFDCTDHGSASSQRERFYPFQCALSTRAGTECTHIFQATSETILSVVPRDVIFRGQDPIHPSILRFTIHGFW